MAVETNNTPQSSDISSLGVKHPLVDKLILTFDRFGEVECQGRIDAVFSTGGGAMDTLLVEWFSWVDGTPTHATIIPIGDLFLKYTKENKDKSHCRIYSTVDTWRDAGAHFYKNVYDRNYSDLEDIEECRQ